MKKKWTVIVLTSAAKRVSGLPKSERERIRRAINNLEEGPYNNANIKRLNGRPEWRLRVGGWRVLFLVENETITITVVSVEPRGDAYK